MNRDQVDALRKGAVLTRNFRAYTVIKVSGLAHANLRYRKIWLQPLHPGSRKQALDGDQMIDCGWGILTTDDVAKMEL